MAQYMSDAAARMMKTRVAKLLADQVEMEKEIERLQSHWKAKVEQVSELMEERNVWYAESRRIEKEIKRLQGIVDVAIAWRQGFIHDTDTTDRVFSTPPLDEQDALYEVVEAEEKREAAEKAAEAESEGE